MLLTCHRRARPVGGGHGEETCREGMVRIGDLSSPPRDAAIVVVGGDG